MEDNKKKAKKKALKNLKNTAEDMMSKELTKEERLRKVIKSQVKDASKRGKIDESVWFSPGFSNNPKETRKTMQDLGRGKFKDAEDLVTTAGKELKKERKWNQLVKKIKDKNK